MTVLAGIDIGGTKCAVSIARIGDDDGICILDRTTFETLDSPHDTLNQLILSLAHLQESNQVSVDSIGISCGGPLDPKTGVVMSPPNLPNWDAINVCDPFEQKFSVPVRLENDANASVIAEWKWGAGRGCNHVVFLTFGTGLGAGLILNGALYRGTNHLAGEVGHIRLAEEGPVGYGKPGSFEGFCSGGGIARLSQTMAHHWLSEGKTTALIRTTTDIADISAKKVAEAAQQGDELSLAILERTGAYLGRGLAILIDVLNPERIIIGGIFARQCHPWTDDGARGCEGSFRASEECVPNCTF